ncbi:hypothetical protein IJI69_01070 [Candidatus Saccharibacteria bacterium]|nr:hypothetical protein [Candidatus Saccharibacteria bacterium]
MVQNLRLIGSRTLTSSDSDVTSNYTLPASSLSWGTTATMYNSYAYYDSSRSEWGAYYNWYTATAGIRDSSLSVGAEAPTSVCPKNWTLPNYYNFRDLINLNVITKEIFNGQYNGVIMDRELSRTGSEGGLFSRDISWAGGPNMYVFGYGLGGSPVSAGGAFYSHTGRSVRCIAR